MAHKQEVINNLTVFDYAVTSLRTPIIIIFYNTEDPTFDLQKFLLDNEYLLTVSCGTYYALDKKAVRIMMPTDNDMPKLISKLNDAQLRLG
jgi:hypothetical protein